MKNLTNAATKKSIKRVINDSLLGNTMEEYSLAKNLLAHFCTYSTPYLLIIGGATASLIEEIKERKRRELENRLEKEIRA